MRLSFVVPGPPVPKARARRGKGGRWYTPDETRLYERHVGACARVALALARLASRWPMDAEYRLTARMYFADRRRRDADNVVKSLADGCIGVLWADDHRVGIAADPWQIDRDNPRVEMVVEVIDA